MSPLRIWVTRAQPGAAATAARLTALGRDPLVAPLLEVRPVAGAALDLDGVAALAFTSANGVDAFSALCDRRSLPVFAVGETTAAAARAAGFKAVRSAEGDVAALSGLIVDAPAPGIVLHIAPETPAGDLAGALAAAGVACRTLALYRTLAAGRLPAAVEDALARGEIDAVLIHSPRAAEAAARLVGAATGLRVFALSPACAAPLRRLGFRVAVAERPVEAALLALVA